MIRRAIKLGLHWIGCTICPGLNGYTYLRLLRPLWPNVMPPYGLCYNDAGRKMLTSEVTAQKERVAVPVYARKEKVHTDTATEEQQAFPACRCPT